MDDNMRALDAFNEWVDNWSDVTVQADVDLVSCGETVRAALTKSAKVDGLLEAIMAFKDTIHGDGMSWKEAEAIADKAIQRFNGEV